MAKTQNAASVQGRPFNAAWQLVFGAIALGGLYVMRIDAAQTGYPQDFDKVVETARFPSGVGHPRELPLPRFYLGVPPLDYGLGFLVAAFTPGAMAWDPAYTLLQLHFLVNFAAVLGIWNVEASRRGNQGKLFTYTSLFAILYQTVGGAVIIPLWYMAHSLSSFHPSSSSSSPRGRPLTVKAARSLLPSTVIGYLLPTIAMYIPWADRSLTFYVAAAWQVCPIWANLLQLVLSNAPDPEDMEIRPPAVDPNAPVEAARPPRAPKVKTQEELDEEENCDDDAVDLKRFYRTLLGVCVLAHAAVLYVTVASPSSSLAQSACTTSSSSWISSFLPAFLGGESSPSPLMTPLCALSRVFLPDPSRRTDGFAEGLHYIMQWDWVGIAVSSLLWCVMTVRDIVRAQATAGLTTTPSGGLLGSLQTFALIFGGAVFLGPGAVMALVWSWREEKILAIENVAKEEKMKLKKDA